MSNPMRGLSYRTVPVGSSLRSFRLPGLRQLVLAGLALMPLSAQVSQQNVATIGQNRITLEAFAQRYSAYLQRTSLTDARNTRMTFLKEWVEEVIVQQYAHDTGLDQALPILTTGYEAWKAMLLDEVAQVHLNEAGQAGTDLIEAEYRYRNTRFLSRYLTLTDSLSAVDYLKRLKAGESFEYLALMNSVPRAILDQPGEPNWQFSHQLDPTYARVAYLLAPGQYSAPFRHAQGYQIIQLLDKAFQPDHGHFERVKRYQQIASELEREINTRVAEETLRQWAADLPIKWRRWATRKILRSRILAKPQPEVAEIPPEPELMDVVLFKLNGESYTLDWVLSRLDLLPPGDRFNIDNVATFRERVRRMLMWDRLVGLAAALPETDAILRRADSLQAAVIHTAIKDSVITGLLREIDPGEDSLRLLLAQHPLRYTTPALMNLEEIVVQDFLWAVTLKDSLRMGADFGALARTVTERSWGRQVSGKLGWVPVGIYGAAVLELAGAKWGEVVGPVSVGQAFVLVRLHGYREAGLPPYETLVPRLRHDWIRTNRRRLIREWIKRLQATTYPTTIDTSLLAGLRLGVPKGEPTVQFPTPKPLPVGTRSR